MRGKKIVFLAKWENTQNEKKITKAVSSRENMLADTYCACVRYSIGSKYTIRTARPISDYIHHQFLVCTHTHANA